MSLPVLLQAGGGRSHLGQRLRHAQRVRAARPPQQGGPAGQGVEIPPGPARRHARQGARVEVARAQAREDHEPARRAGAAAGDRRRGRRRQSGNRRRRGYESRQDGENGAARCSGNTIGGGDKYHRRGEGEQCAHADRGSAAGAGAGSRGDVQITGQQSQPRRRSE
jgi:hypothetical protein